jgi:hypothetical protein
MDVMARAPGSGRRGDATLFGDDALELVGRASEARRAIAAIPDDSLAQVKRKEALLAALDSGEGPLATWRRVCDLWCACWFWPVGDVAPRPAEFGAMCGVLRGQRTLAPAALGGRLDTAMRVARAERFFHWALEFPEVIEQGGFDAVIGNPPWDMVRGSVEARRTLRFTRDSGVYRLQSSGHGNLYQLFLERMLQLARSDGRVGVVLPWGLATDHGSTDLRAHVLDRCTLDELVVFENRRGIFPIHRGLKFCAAFVRNAGSSSAVRYGPAVSDPAALGSADEERAGLRPRIELSRRLLEALSGPSLSLPYIESSEDVGVLERLVAAAPAAADPRGWGVQFSRELNASDDKRLFLEGGDGYPVISGRHIEPFRVNARQSALRMSASDAHRRLGPAVHRPRLAYRDVAGPGNRLTLIAAIVPPHVVTTHTLFCLRRALPEDEQWFLCAVLNSYVANFIVRTRVGTHVTTALVHALPIPRPHREAPEFGDIVRLGRSGESPDLQAAVASLYGLDQPMFERILASFPLIPSAQRSAASAALAERLRYSGRSGWQTTVSQ